ncbi:5'-methylthioadenosine/S-adenosylhomocysteine nucleosidase [Microvirga sp. W0021]|uniref:5'-methylthioadenosine/S-adenosylhomocysteine nucleosidase n=1 Tax=Hohaiivirga grylli TaxID=3133970 RepID=A0ABV0BFV4_9HYPH
MTRPDILYVMAAEAEYGPHLKALIKPLMTGVGPVEAAIALTKALCEAKADNHLPKAVVSLGSSGSARLAQTELYQATSVSYRDMDATYLGVEKGKTPFLDLPAVLPLPIHIPGIPAASLSTGADIVSGTRYDEIAEDMVDMECYALMRVCQTFGVPFIAIRGISDGASELHHVDDWTRYLDIIDKKLADIIPVVEHTVLGKA